jgi:hypothetical protein
MKIDQKIFDPAIKIRSKKQNNEVVDLKRI